MSVDNEFSNAFSTAFDLTGGADLPCIEVDWSCMSQEEQGALDPGQKVVAELFAQAAIRVLTAGQFGQCPITIRPCVTGCAPKAGDVFSASPWMVPYISEGKWYNACGCRPTDCSCTNLTEIVVEHHVGEIVSIFVDGLLQNPGDYRVDNGNRIVRLGGDEWYGCQDMARDDSLPGTMSVTYLPGNRLDRVGKYVAGLLAREYLGACNGSDCRLPSSVVSMSRQGVSFQMGQDTFPGGKTGIEPVDLWVQSWNPYAVKSHARVFSPERKSQRRTTWSA